MKHGYLTSKIIACAYQVYNTIGFGFLESVYENCMMIELKSAGIAAEAQRGIKVTYKDKIVGEFYADILVGDEVIVELKSVQQIIARHEVQLVNYLVATGKDVGLLINFGRKKVEVKRRVRSLRDCV